MSKADRQELVMLISAVAAAVVFLYATFESKDHAREVDARLTESVKVIDAKISVMGRFPPGWEPPPTSPSIGK